MARDNRSRRSSNPPGLDLTALTPEAWSTRPSATVIGPLLDALVADNTTGPLAGLLDLDRVVLAGHSAGGPVALLNANPAWFGGVVAAISYAGHTMPAALLGHPPGTVLAVPGALPALLIAGGNDAIIAASAVRYTSDTSDTSGASVARTESTDQHDPISATFERGATAPGSTLAVLATATHLSICDPVDTTSARGFLEDDDPDGPAHRDLIVAIIGSFLDEVLGMGGDHPAVLSFGADPLVSELRRW